MKTIKVLAVILLAMPVLSQAELLHSPKTEVMDFQDLNYYRTDCSHRTEQLAFLKNQLDNVPFWEKRSKAVINYYIRFIKASCPEPEPAKFANCLSVREQFGENSSQATVCRSPNFKGPVINRWENEIDN